MEYQSNMEENSNLKLGQWDVEENAHNLQCQNDACKKYFFGRKNKKYCSGKCKIKTNNELAARRVLEIKGNVDPIDQINRFLSKISKGKDVRSTIYLNDYPIETQYFNVPIKNTVKYKDSHGWMLIGKFYVKKIQNHDRVDFVEM